MSNDSLWSVLERVIEQYRSAHPDEAAEADQQCKDYKPFSEIEPAVFSIPILTDVPDTNAEEEAEN
jgi:hypothetical protein